VERPSAQEKKAKCVTLFEGGRRRTWWGRDKRGFHLIVEKRRGLRKETIVGESIEGTWLGNGNALQAWGH